MAFAAHFEFSAEVVLQVLVQGMVLLVNAERCFEPGLGFAVRAKGILGVGKLIGNELFLFSRAARTLIAATSFLQQCFYAAVPVSVFLVLEGGRGDAGLSAEGAYCGNTI